MANSKRVVILGVTGFIGRGLPRLLKDQGFEVVGVSRSGAGDLEGVDHWQKLDEMALSGSHAVINMAGEPINQRWTDELKQRFHDSRVGLTQRIAAQIQSLPESERPQVWVNGSAVGIYGNRGDEVLTEESAMGEGYLAELCNEWELAALPAKSLGVRVVCMRTGIVIGNGGGALQQMLPIFKWGLGGRLGSGRQWMPWIHIDDLRGGIVHAVLTESVDGPVNGSAPGLERNEDFTDELAAVLKRPAVLPVPGFALKLAFGGFGEALLDSQRAEPAALEGHGYQFKFPTLEMALEDLL